MSASGHRQLIAKFYEALDRRDAPTMIACYAPEATFTDPVFGKLDAAGVAAMWRMLCERGKDLVITFDRPTGRRVVNEIDAAFTFRHGLIVEHVDTFNLKRWAKQALGLSGHVLGFTPLLAPMVRKQAAASLAAWRKREAGP